MATVVVATMSTRNFDFEVVANNRKEATTLLRAAWDEHVRRYPDATARFNDRDVVFLNYETRKIGVVYHQGEEFNVSNRRKN